MTQAALAAALAADPIDPVQTAERIVRRVFVSEYANSLTHAQIMDAAARITTERTPDGSVVCYGVPLTEKHFATACTRLVRAGVLRSYSSSVRNGRCYELTDDLLSRMLNLGSQMHGVMGL